MHQGEFMIHPGFTEENHIGPQMVNKFGDKYFYEINRNNFNRDGSWLLFKEKFDHEIFHEDTLYLIIGTDSGLLLNYINEKKRPDGARYLFIELPEVIEKISPIVNFSPQIALVSPEQWMERASDFKLQEYFYLGRLSLHLSFAAQDGYFPGYPDVIHAVRQKLEEIEWGNAASLDHEIYILRQMQNLPENRLSAGLLRGKFAGRSAVLLGGGPSLDDSFEWIRANRSHLTVLAVSRVCRRLLDVGISPDFVFSVDPHSLSFDVSKEMLRFWQDTTFINLYHVTPLLLGQWRGVNFYLGERFPWASPMNEDCLLTVGATVTNHALGTALEMGFSQVILSGVDLCYSREGVTHARGSNEAAVGPQLAQIRPQVETNGGWMAETDHALAVAIRFLEGEAAKASEKGCQIFNPADGAARVHGVLHGPFEDLMLPVALKTPVQIVNEVLLSVADESRDAYYQQVVAELNRAEEHLGKISDLVQEALECNSNLFRGQGRPFFSKNRVRMEEIEGALNGEHRDFSFLAQKFGIRAFLKITRVKESEEWSEAEIENTGKLYYEAYQNSVQKLRVLVQAARDRLLSRMEEEKASPDFDQMIHQWKKDGQPGRFLVWRSRYLGREDLLSERFLECGKALEREFEELLQHKETEHLKRCTSFSSLSGVRSKALFLFKAQDGKGLERLALGLQRHNGDDGGVYLDFIKGLLAELSLDTKIAMDSYSRILETGQDQIDEPLLEEVLRRILILSLQNSDWENALAALNCLTVISCIYLPHQAELFRILGANSEALNAYANYLESMPDDIMAMIRLGKYYRELHVEEGARMMFMAVLERDPDNEAVRTLLEDSPC